MELWNKEMPHYNEAIDFVPYLTCYPQEGAKLGVVVCPGGGYGGRAEHEGKVYAQWLNSIGVAAVVLEYRVSPYRTPAEPSDVQRAIRIARKELGAMGVEKIGVMGSSAGGHLAALASVHYDKVFYEPVDEADALSARPDFTVLCYPVIDFFKYVHEGSMLNLLGPDPSEAVKTYYSPQLQVTADTPTAFLWHTASDTAVPAENSMLYAMALSEYKIPYELHIYPEGTHGQGLAVHDPYLHEWTHALERWLKKLGA